MFGQWSAVQCTYIKLFEDRVFFYPREHDSHGVGAILQERNLHSVHVVGEFLDVCLQLCKGWNIAEQHGSFATTKFSWFGRNVSFLEFSVLHDKMTPPLLTALLSKTTTHPPCTPVPPGFPSCPSATVIASVSDRHHESCACRRSARQWWLWAARRHLLQCQWWQAESRRCQSRYEAYLENTPDHQLGSKERVALINQ